MSKDIKKIWDIPIIRFLDYTLGEGIIAIETRDKRKRKYGPRDMAPKIIKELGVLEKDVEKT